MLWSLDNGADWLFEQHCGWMCAVRVVPPMHHTDIHILLHLPATWLSPPLSASCRVAVAVTAPLQCSSQTLLYSSGHLTAALLLSHQPSCPRGFPVEHYKDNRPGLVVAFWGLALILGRVQISQTDRQSDGTVFGSILNHVTVGRFADGG